MSKLPPIIPHFSPENSPLNRTYEALLRDANRKDALDERTKQKSPHKNNTDHLSPTINMTVTPEFDGSHVQTQRFASDLLQRVGLNTDDDDEEEERELQQQQQLQQQQLLQQEYSHDRDQLSTAASTPYNLTPSNSIPPTRNKSSPGNNMGKMDIGASPATLRRNHNLVQVLNDVQQVTLCFQEIIKHISFHRVNTGRVLWKLQATYVQLFERLIKVFSQRQKQEQEKLKVEGGAQNQELDMLRLQVMDKQAKLDAAEKTKHQYKDTIKEQMAHISILQNEVSTLRAAIVEEASVADEAARRRESDQLEIRHKVELDVKERSDARKALFGGHEPSELDTAFTDSLGTMFHAIEDADIQSQKQETLLNDMNSLMDVQQFTNPFDLATAAFRKLRSRQNANALNNVLFEYDSDDSTSTDGKEDGFSQWKQIKEVDHDDHTSKKKHHPSKKKSPHKTKHTDSFNSVSSPTNNSSSSSSSPKHSPKQHHKKQHHRSIHSKHTNHSKHKHTNHTKHSKHFSSDSDSDEQMLQERERKAAETEKAELKQKFEKERAELATERASMIKQMNKMREDIEQEQAALEEKQAAHAEEAEQHASNARKAERIAARDKKSKMSNAQQLMNSVSAMGASGPQSDSQTQTVVDEECLWETEGCKEVAISGAALDKIWKDRKIAADQFYGKLVVTRKHDPLVNPKHETELNNTMKDQDQINSNRSSSMNGPITRGTGGWLIPPSTRHFMSNLPKTVESQPIKNLPWLMKMIDEIYQQKLVADYYDNRDGDPLQSLPDFLCEYLLMKFGLRRVAEMHLYEVIMSVKKYFSKNPKVLMFGRFLGCVKIKGKMASGNATDRHPDTPELDIGVLQVFLYTRRRLCLSTEVLRRDMNTPGGVPVAGQTDNATGKDEDEDGGPPGAKKDKKTDVSHVVHTKNHRTYVPLGHAILELRKVTSFMAPRKLIKFMRTIERGVAMRKSHEHDTVHKVSNDTGGSTAVRIVMRNSMLGDTNRPDSSASSNANSRPGSTATNSTDKSKKEEEKEKGGHESSDWHVVCCLDTSLEVLLDILELRSKQVYEELVRAFVEGDDNGDGVLSFDEFESIIQNKRPEFSSRRALRMFKLALESGGGNSTAIERPAFVRTCKQFGLGKLVNLEEV